MRKNILLLLLVSIYLIKVNGQFDCAQDLQLLKHLTDTKKPYESLVLSSSMLRHNQCNQFFDSIAFYRGFAYYQLKELDSATQNFLKVQFPDSLYNKARFYAIISSLYADKPSHSDSILRTIKNTSSLIVDLKNVCQAGIMLYQKNYEQYANFSTNLNFDNYLLSNEISGLRRTYENYYRADRKSPTKAAIYSAIFPGSGKWYLGKRGQAITSFLTVGILAGISSELISKQGWGNFFSISALTTTAIFYGGNIYGSYYLGKYINKRLDEKIKQDVQYYLHVAVRNVYF